MADIAMCGGEHCPIKQKCYRYTATPNQEWQSWHDYVYDPDKKQCDGYLVR